MNDAPKPLNDQLRQARLRTASPSGSGRPMSRQELADAVNAYLADKNPGAGTLDANHVGKLERGEHRWMSPARREAFRHALGATTDAELGFYIVRGMHSRSAEESLPTVAVSSTTASVKPQRPSADDDPALIPHWSSMLRVLAATHDAFGPRYLHDVVRGEISLIRRHRTAGSMDIHGGLLDVECRWAEFASWTSANLGDQDSAAHWLRHALSLARQADNSAMIAYVLMRQAQQAVDFGNAPRARALAEEAHEQPMLTDRDRALCAIRYAQALSLAGDRPACSAALREASRLVARADDLGGGDEPDTVGRHCVRPYVTAHEGYCLLTLGDHRGAIAVLEEVLTGWPSAYRQDEALARAWLALSYAGAGRPTEAATEGTRALALATDTGSARALQTLRRLGRRLVTHARLPEADQFLQAHRALGERLGKPQ